MVVYPLKLFHNKHQNGSSLSIHDNNMEDHEHVYYRLRMVDNQDKVSYSKVMEISENLL